jgi:hypothetical protein
MPATIRDLRTKNKPPTAIEKWDYFDKIAFWIPQLFTEPEVTFIKAQCGPGGTDIDRPSHRARFDPRLIKRIETRQPGGDLLAFLATVDGLLLNMVEFTLDLIFDTEEDRDRAFDFIDRHHVKKAHRGNVRYFKETRYSDRRWAPSNFVAYRPAFAKTTGELHCLHLEWRVCGVEALRRIGIHGINDLIEFDARAHWQSWLRLRTFDFAQLGRTHSTGGLRKRSNETHRNSRIITPRKPRTYITRRGFEYHTDRRLGQVLFRNAETVQGVIDAANKRKIPVTRCLVEIDNSEWLPVSVK